jgi:HD superfamily phosphohydrolase
LISSLVLNANGDGLAITSKGKTAAEMMVFARYVMFSEVYWHHAVRSATAMFQRAFFELRQTLNLDRLSRLTDEPFAQAILAASAHHPAGELVESLFGDQRRLYKRWGQFSCFDTPDIFAKLARQPYGQLVKVAEQLATLLSDRLQTPLTTLDVLVDAPPPGLEVQFEIEVRNPKNDINRPLGELSPVVQALAKVQFDDYVKQVRLFLHPRLADDLKNISPEPILWEAIRAVGL